VRVVQLLLSPLPKKLEPCVASVRAFAERMHCPYQVITDLPDWADGYAFLGAVSDRIKLELMATETEVFIPDWDIMLGENFSLPNHPAFCNEISAVWNAGELFTRWHEELIKYNEQTPTHKAEYCRVPKIMTRSGYQFRYLGNLTHLKWR